MTTIDATQNEPVPTPQALRAQMEFAAAPPRIGAEVEFHIQDLRSDEDPAPASDERVRALKDVLRARHGMAVDDEIAGHMLEIKTDAYEIGDIKKLLRDLARMQAAVVNEAAALGLKPAPGGVLAGLTADRALRNLIAPTPEDPERGARPRTVLEGLRTRGMEAYPLLNVSAQVSIGARDPEHLFAMVRRHNTLLPFLFTLLHNRPPCFDAQGNKTGVHTGIAARAANGPRGLVSGAFAGSGSAESYIMRELEAAYKRPMFAYVDVRGAFNAAAQGETVTMQTLARQGLATRANALLSLATDWASAKIKTIPGTRCMRAEMRDMDTAGHHAASLVIINGLMNMDEDCGRAVDRLLAGFGYGGAPIGYSTRIDKDLARVAKDARAGMDVPYGNGIMRDFAQYFILTLMPYIEKHGLAEECAPLIHACMTGETEAQALDRILHSPRDVARYQRDYDPALLADPRRSLALSLARGARNG